MRLPIETPWGVFQAHYSETGLAQLDFPKTSGAKRPASSSVPRVIEQWHKLCSAALLAMLQNQPVGQLPPLDLSAGTTFQKQVWAALRKIKSGRHVSYTQLAEMVGKPRAARAAGSACGRNPIPIIIPCHRVLTADRKIGGFSGGLAWKERLLALEGVELQS